MGIEKKPIQNRIVNDEELVVRLQRGDEWAFQLLIRRFREKIFCLAFGITLDVEESQALTQDIFSRVYVSVLDYNANIALKTWLCREAVNRCLSWKRRWTRRFSWGKKSGGQGKRHTRPEAIGDLSGPKKSNVDPQILRQIDIVLSNLSEQDRAVFILRELEAFSYDDIAYITDSKPESIKTRMFHTRSRLVSHLQTLAMEVKTAQ